MMPAPSDKPLRKCTLNLFADDVAYLERTYGQGWTEHVRQAVERHVISHKQYRKVIEDGQ